MQNIYIDKELLNYVYIDNFIDSDYKCTIIMSFVDDADISFISETLSVIIVTDNICINVLKETEKSCISKDNDDMHIILSGEYMYIIDTTVKIDRQPADPTRSISIVSGSGPAFEEELNDVYEMVPICQDSQINLKSEFLFDKVIMTNDKKTYASTIKLKSADIIKFDPNRK